MNISDRVLYLAIGGLIGFILGYIVRSLRGIETELEETEKKHKKHDDGRISGDLVNRVAVFLVVCLTAFAAFRSQSASNKSDDAVDGVQASNVATCENGNESRAASKVLWDFVIDVSVASPGNQQSPKALRYLQTIREWIDKVYRPHDCKNLTKKYPIPPPPKIITFKPHKHKHK